METEKGNHLRSITLQFYPREEVLLEESGPVFRDWQGRCPYERKKARGRLDRELSWVGGGTRPESTVAGQVDLDIGEPNLALVLDRRGRIEHLFPITLGPPAFPVFRA